jgi:signal transduction histidine kinase
MSPAVPFAAGSGAQVSLADHLAARQEQIPGAWDAALSADDKLIGSDDLFRAEFRNHIPEVLAKFLGALRAELPAGSVQPAAHRAVPATDDEPHRWQHRYDLWEVILEWAHLHHCLLEELEAARTALPALAPDVLASAQHSLASLVHLGIADCAEQFARLQQKEAIGERDELERTVERFLERDRRRATHWRESAHDLRGQLTIISSAASLMEVEDLEEPLRMAAFAMLHSGTGAFKRVLTVALEVATQDTDREECAWEAFDAGILLGGLCAATQPLARERGLSLRAHGPQPLAVEGDPGKVRRIAQNLLLNALSSTSQGGVTVTWKMDDADCWSLEVHDTGPGMPSGDHAPQAMETSPPRAEGPGLPIVERLGQLLGARLYMETSPGAGTVCTVIFPRHYAA